MSRAQRVLQVSDLHVTFTGARHVEAVKGVSFHVDRGESVAIVGESGSGKSVTARTLVGLTGDGAQVRASELTIAGVDASHLNDRGWRRLRGRTVGLVLQDALTSLDPLRTVGQEITEVLRTHRVVPARRYRTRVQELLTEVGIPDAQIRARQYSHQLSGGLRQRALIASAIAGEPDLLIADEPTTALDVTVQAQILRLLDARRSAGTSLLLISHDLAVVASTTDRIIVMRDGEIVEQGRTRDVLDNPQHPYTRSLVGAVPSAASRGRRLTPPVPGAARGPGGVCTADPEAPRLARDRVVLEGTDLVATFDVPGGGIRRAVNGVTLQLSAGQRLGIVGESGSGKSTLARLLLGLLEPTEGVVAVDGVSWRAKDGDRLRRRRAVQFVSQDSLGSFDPRYSVRELIAEPLLGSGTRQEIADRVGEVLALVHLDPALLDETPRRLSGGQRQRVAIARALALRPEVIVCDEPVSALDVSIQAQILDLLDELNRTTGTALVFISHDLGVVHHLVDDVIVMRGGRVVEAGDVEQVFTNPKHPYTQDLVRAVPRLAPPSSRAPSATGASPSGVTVRLIEAPEYTLVASQLIRAFTHGFEITDYYRQRLTEVAERAATSQVWVAVDTTTGVVLGSLVTPAPDAPARTDAPGDEFTFGTLGVDPDARGRGVASTLISHVIDLARELGFDRLSIHSGPQMLGAHRLYERLGFERLPARETLVVDGGQRLLCFGRDLSPLPQPSRIPTPTR